MKNRHHHNGPAVLERNDERTQAAMLQQDDTQEATVTQITPDDVLIEGGPIAPGPCEGTPTQRQLEQDVVTVNPSVDSMESRG